MKNKIMMTACTLNTISAMNLAPEKRCENKKQQQDELWDTENCAPHNEATELTGATINVSYKIRYCNVRQ